MKEDIRKYKFNKVFLPFVFISVGLVVLYTLFNWLVIKRMDLFSLDEKWTNVFIPFIVSALVYIFYFRKCTRRLRTKRGNDGLWLFCILFWAVPICISQFCLDNHLGKLTSLESPSEIVYHPQSLFYSIKKAKPLNGLGGMTVTQHLDGRYNTSLCVTCYFACPLNDDMPKSYNSSGYMDVWIGCSVSNSFPNGRRVDKKKREQDIRKFIRTSKEHFKLRQFNTHYLRNVERSASFSTYLDAIRNSGSMVDRSSIVILKEEKDLYENRSKSQLIWLLATLVAFNLIWLYVVAKAELAKPKNEKEKQKERVRWMKDVAAFFRFFVPEKKSWAASLLIDVNVLVFILICFYGGGLLRTQTEVLASWGAISKSLIADGQYWRLISASFVHNGIFHLIINMAALFVVYLILKVSEYGSKANNAVDDKRFFLCYLLTGLFAQIASIIFNKDTISVGASGAVMGMYGLAFALMVIKYLDSKVRIVFAPFVVTAILLSLLSGYLYETIDMAAHLGGLISGFIIGVVYFPLEKHFGLNSKPANRRKGKAKATKKQAITE